MDTSTRFEEQLSDLLPRHACLKVFTFQTCVCLGRVNASCVVVLLWSCEVTVQEEGDDNHYYDYHY